MFTNLNLNFNSAMTPPEVIDTYPPSTKIGLIASLRVRLSNFLLKTFAHAAIGGWFTLII